MKLKDLGVLLALLLFTALAVAFGYGYFCNIADLLKHGNDMQLAEFMVRFLGIFMAPLGALAGYF